MTKDELYRSLDELSLPESIIGRLGASKWCFWKRKEQVGENDMFPLLREYITKRAGKANTKARGNAYALLAKLLNRRMDLEFCQYLVDRLEEESNKHVLCTMLFGISRLQMPDNIDVAAMIVCSNSEEWMVRHNGIIALGASNTPASREAVRYWVRQADEKKYKFELIYANASLGFIGEPCDITLLEQHVNSRIRDVKDSAIYAVNNIRERFKL